MGNVAENLANNLIRLRKERGWTQDMLAQFSELSQNAITAIESKKRWPGLTTVQKLAKAFGVSEEDLFISPATKSRLTKQEILEIVAESYGLSVKIEKKEPAKPPPDLQGGSKKNSAKILTKSLKIREIDPPEGDQSV